MQSPGAVGDMNTLWMVLTRLLTSLAGVFLPKGLQKGSVVALATRQGGFLHPFPSKCLQETWIPQGRRPEPCRLKSWDSI